MSSSLQGLPPVPYNTQVSQSSGLLSVPWQAWFRQLFSRVGYIGDFSDANSSGPSLPLTTAIGNIASLSLPAGEWDVEGVAAVNLAGFTVTKMIAAISLNSAAADSTNDGGIAELVPGTAKNYIPTGSRRLVLSSDSTVYLVGSLTYSGGSGSWSTDSYIRARRIR